MVPSVIKLFISALRLNSARQPVVWIGHPTQRNTGRVSTSCTQGFSSRSGTYCSPMKCSTIAA